MTNPFQPSYLPTDRLEMLLHLNNVFWSDTQVFVPTTLWRCNTLSKSVITCEEWITLERVGLGYATGTKFFPFKAKNCSCNCEYVLNTLLLFVHICVNKNGIRDACSTADILDCPISPPISPPMSPPYHLPFHPISPPISPPMTPLPWGCGRDGFT